MIESRQRRRKMCLSARARLSGVIDGGTSRKEDGMADHLGAHSNGLRARQAKGRAEVPEELAPTSTLGLSPGALLAEALDESRD